MPNALSLADSGLQANIVRLLDWFGLKLIWVADGMPIPFSYFGAPEAGILNSHVFARTDTPVHSVLHEASHIVCMNTQRRRHLRTDAAGEYAEENAVLYLQVLLAERVGLSAECMCAEMDNWGYTFRLGSALEWFRHETEDCRQQLLDWGILAQNGTLTGRLRV